MSGDKGVAARFTTHMIAQYADRLDGKEDNVIT